MASFSTYHLLSQSEGYYFSHVSNCLDACSSTYDRFLLVDDFNAEYSEETLSNFEKHNAANIVKDKTCLKSLNNPSFIVLFITNRPRCFQNTTAFSTGLSSFHKMAVTVLKISFSKAPPK